MVCGRYVLSIWPARPENFGSRSKIGAEERSGREHDGKGEGGGARTPISDGLIGTEISGHKEMAFFPSQRMSCPSLSCKCIAAMREPITMDTFYTQAQKADKRSANRCSGRSGILPTPPVRRDRPLIRQILSRSVLARSDLMSMGGGWVGLSDLLTATYHSASHSASPPSYTTPHISNA